MVWELPNGMANFLDRKRGGDSLLVGLCDMITRKTSNMDIANKLAGK